MEKSGALLEDVWRCGRCLEAQSWVESSLEAAWRGAGASIDVRGSSQQPSRERSRTATGIDPWVLQRATAAFRRFRWHWHAYTPPQHLSTAPRSNDCLRMVYMNALDQIDQRLVSLKTPSADLISARLLEQGRSKRTRKAVQ